eukprot:m.426121 g.426121  ORF g.426121 m.426121 type:complete len:99 (-) comp20221_c1_seq23:379-675(-)
MRRGSLAAPEAEGSAVLEGFMSLGHLHCAPEWALHPQRPSGQPPMPPDGNVSAAGCNAKDGSSQRAPTCSRRCVAGTHFCLNCQQAAQAKEETGRQQR